MAIIKSLLENDFYKFTMCQVILHYFPEANVEYHFSCRNKNIHLGFLAESIAEEIVNLCTLTFKEEELNFLRNISFLKNDFIHFLRILKLNKNFITITNDNGHLNLIIKGPWIHTIWFEIPILAIINELYFKKYQQESLYKEGKIRLTEKINLIKNNSNILFKFSDFGLRRRFSGKWQYSINEILKKELQNNFVGTSNVYIAKELKLTPIGTMAHEFLMATQAMVRLIDSQKYALEIWALEYRGNLGIALTDVIGMDAFLEDFDLYFCKLYDGCRHDSGDPYIWCKKLLNHYKKIKINSKTKTVVFSDGLTFPLAIDLAQTFNSEINTSFGIGTNLTNDMGINSLNIVIKMTSCNNTSVAKISDSSGKTICKDREYITHLKSIFKVIN